MAGQPPSPYSPPAPTTSPPAPDRFPMAPEPSQQGFSSPIDWSNLEIVQDSDEENIDDSNDPMTEEGTDDFNVFMADEEMYSFLDLREDDMVANNNVGGNVGDGTEGEADEETMDVEEHVDCDQEDVTMAVGATYSCMNKFRMALRNYAVSGEFDVKPKKSDPTRYVGVCKMPGCPWKVVAKRVQGQENILAKELGPDHQCPSTSRKTSSMADQAWIAHVAVPILKLYPNMGAMELKVRLDNEHNLKLDYDAVWKGRERAMNQLYGSWADSFQMLYNYKAEVELRSPGSIVEIDTKNVEGVISIQI